MQFSFSSFSTILSELSALPGYLRSRIATAVLYPFGIVVLALGAMLGYALGWDAVKSFWDGVSLWPKAILTAVTVIGFFFLAYILSSFQGFVSRAFQGEWPGWMLWILTKQIRQHQYEWQRRHDESQRLQVLYRDLKTVLDTLKDDSHESTASKPEAARAAQPLPAYHIITAADLKPVPVDAAETNSLTPTDAIGLMTLQHVPQDSPLLREQVASIPHRIWVEGMTLVPLGLTQDAVPLGLAPGDAVSLYRVSRGEQPINPGGWLVVSVQSPTPEAESSQDQTVLLTLAAPPEAIPEVMPYVLAKDVFVARRKLPDLPRIWGVVPRTRRWLPISSAVEVAPLPGDLIDIEYRGVALRLEQACFLDTMDGGWIVAVTLDDAARLPSSRGLRQAQPKVERSVVHVPAFTQEIKQYSLTLQPDTSVPGQVIAGQFVWPGGAAKKIVADRQELIDRFPTADIPPDTPILWSQLNDPAEDQGIVDLRAWWQLGEMQYVHLVYGARLFDQSRSVIFNCRVVKSGGQRRLLVPKAQVKTINAAQVMYALPAHSVPAHWRVWTDARHITYPARNHHPEAYDEGLPVGLLVTRRVTSDITIGDLFGVTGIIFRPYPQTPEKISLLVDQRRAEAMRLPQDGYHEAILLYREHEARELDLLSCQFAAAASPELLSTDKLITLQKAALKAKVLLDLHNEQDPGAYRVQATLGECTRRFRELLKVEQREAEYRSTEARKRFRLYYPSEQVAVAPTSIGNALQSVNSYCDELYGLDPALVLPRLSPLMSKEMSEQVSMAKEKLDLLEWSWIGMAVIGVGGFIIAVLGGEPRLGLLTLAPTLPIGWLILNAAKSAAISYAEILRLAFDRERGKIFEMLKLKLDAETNQEDERKLWLAVAQWWLDGSLPKDYRYLLTENGEEAA